jgi:signal transduction histidine kinase
MYLYLRGRMRYVILAAFLFGVPPLAGAQSARTGPDQTYEHADTRALVALVDGAADLLRVNGESAFVDLAATGSRWRGGDSYVFVLDPDGNMLVHPDPSLQGKNQLALKDINGKPIIRGLLDAALATPVKPQGWYHYEWPVPGEFQPRWKSSYVRLVAVPSGKRYVVGAGMYNDRMERAFAVDAVKDAVARIEADGAGAFTLLRDRTGPFMIKDTYVFVLDPNGVELVNPGFPNLEGRNILDVKDTRGKPLVRELLKVADTGGSGWVDYMWPKPGEGISTQKSTYASKARVGNSWVLVGCGVYLADAPKSAPAGAQMTAPDLMRLVKDAAATLEARGESAYPLFRERGSKWLHDDLYVFVWTLDGKRVFHGGEPETEGQDIHALKDTLGRPYGRMLLDAAASAPGEGWVHYMRPEPGDIFPIWKSSFVRRVTFPSGTQYAVGAGVYNMAMDRALVEDLVDRAAALVAARGKDAFPLLRDKTGPYVFMDTYVFVDTPDGVEVVNAGVPAAEGMNLTGLADVKGKKLADEYIAAALKDGSAWVDYYWYRPGTNTPTLKRAYVRAVKFGADTYIVGSGLYVEQPGSTDLELHHR